MEIFNNCWLWNLDPFKTSKHVEDCNAFKYATEVVCARCDELLWINVVIFKVRVNYIKDVSQNAKCNTVETLPNSGFACFSELSAFSFPLVAKQKEV